MLKIGQLSFQKDEEGHTATAFYSKRRLRVELEPTHLARACREPEPVEPGRPVRLPGQAGLARKRAALKEGLELHPAIMPPLAEWADRLGVALPKAL